MKRNNSNKIKALIFDIGGVLVLSKSQTVSYKRYKRTLGVHNYIVKKLNISIDQWFDAIDRTYTLAIEGKISKEKALNLISKNLNISVKKLENLLIKAYRDNFKQNKFLYNIVSKLKKQGYKVAILSDQWQVSKKAVISESQIKQFDVSVVSCDVGIRKPNPKIYFLTLKRLNLKPNQTVFIDNQSWNIKPAKKIGMNTILFKDNNQLIKQLKKLGVRV
ncbi:MAG: HAD family phosphatase [Nanoarchaeota archaeon]